jgi:hypothetical protein
VILHKINEPVNALNVGEPCSCVVRLCDPWVGVG